MTYKKKVWLILQKEGYKKTKSRTAIIDILAKTKTAISFVDIVKLSKNKKLNQVTVYRFLQDLEKFHLVKKITSLHGYMICEGETHKHNHYFLVCNNCKNITETVINETENIVNILGIYPDQNSIEIVGKCSKCRAKEL